MSFHLVVTGAFMRSRTQKEVCDSSLLSAGVSYSGEIGDVYQLGDAAVFLEPETCVRYPNPVTGIAGPIALIALIDPPINAIS